MVQPVVYENGTHRVGSMSELVSISQQDGNMMSFGQDGGLFIDGNAILSNGETSNLIVISSIDKKIYLSEDNLIKAGFNKGGSAIISSITNNLLQADGNNKLFVTIDNIKAAGFQTASDVAGAITSAISGISYVTPEQLQTAVSGLNASTLRSQTDDNLITISGNDGKLIVTKQSLLDQGFALTNSEGLDVSNVNKIVSTDKANALKLGSDNLLFVPTDMGVLS